MPQPERTPRTGTLIRPPERTEDAKRPKKRGDSAPPKKAGIGAYLLLCLLPLLAFAPMFGSDLLWSTYDQPERTPYTSMEHWSEAWTLESIRTQNPLSLSSYFAEEHIPLPAPQVHRGINLLLHLLAVLLLLKTLESLRLPAAFSTALVFALHPAVVQTLFWPGYRDEVIGLIFILAALYFGIRSRNAASYCLALLLTSLASVIHPAALVIPVILALTILFKEKHLHLSSYNRVLPLVCLCLFIGVWIQGGGSAEVLDPDALAALYQAGQNMSFFFRQALLPLDPALFHPMRTDNSHLVAPQISLLPFFLFLPFLVFLAFNIKKTWARASLLGLASYLLLVLYGVMQAGRFIDGNPAHEDYGQYVALPAILALVIGGAGSLARKTGTGGSALWVIGFSIFILIQFAITASFTYAISAPPRMWQHLAEMHPDSWVPKAALIQSLEARDEAILSNRRKIEMLNTILAQRPELSDLRHQLARIYLAEGQNTNAVREYQRLLRGPRPTDEILEEAARFFDREGLSWEAANARQRIVRKPE